MNNSNIKKSGLKAFKNNNGKKKCAMCVWKIINDK